MTRQSLYTLELKQSSQQAARMLEVTRYSSKEPACLHAGVSEVLRMMIMAAKA